MVCQPQWQLLLPAKPKEEHEKLLETGHPKIHSAEIKAIGVEDADTVIQQLKNRFA